jgi:gamma-glutamylcyclotransferase
MIRYAAYGSNLHPIRLADRAPSSQLLGKSYIANWTLQFHKLGKDGSAKCNIFERGAGVYVAVFELNGEEKATLDRIEGRGYEDVSIQVPGFGECFTYVASASHIRSDRLPFDWYKEMVILGCRKLDFPNGYTADIESTDTTRDPDTARNRSMWRVVEKLRG